MGVWLARSNEEQEEPVCTGASLVNAPVFCTNGTQEQPTWQT